jgi:MarR family transcriptional regulator, transcriptional regulator for hemolysin
VGPVGVPGSRDRHGQMPPGRPGNMPIGMLVARVGKAFDRAFDDALATAGGTRPTWLILLAVKSGAGTTQTSLARHVGISGPTLIHHLDRLESAALVARTRDPANRRPYAITLTPAGDDMFVRLRDAAVAFDRRLRNGISDGMIADLRGVLTALSDNLVSAGPAATSDPSATPAGRPTREIA